MQCKYAAAASICSAAPQIMSVASSTAKSRLTYQFGIRRNSTSQLNSPAKALGLTVPQIGLGPVIQAPKLGA
jgi:hypothetical protein